MRKHSPTIIAAACLLLGLLGGYFAGRWKLESEWKQPIMLVAPDATGRRSAVDQDLAPPAGSRILRPMPLERTRLAARAVTEKDPLVMTVGTVGRGDEGDELHLTLENRGACAVAGYEGVAYGFDAWGNPSPLNASGENYIGFVETASIAPKATYQHSTKLKYRSVVNLVVAQVDRVVCADGVRWQRSATP
jgi:hypothetical protein